MLYGRDAEREAIGALLDAARESRSGVLVIRGEAGSGKTALLEDARERAEDMQTLTLRGVESESELPFAGLHQLLRPALHLVERLPVPQARALQAALGFTERTGDDQFLISAACLTLLSELAEQRPVLCLVDDVQWIDTPSVDALLFVARRLGADGIAMLIAAREGDERRFEARELADVTLPGLDGAAAAAVIANGVAIAVAPSVRDALVQQAAGNALALVELPRALTDAQLSGAQPLPESLPLTRIEHVFLARIRELPEATQRLLLVVAADETGSLGAILNAAEAVGVADDALDSAERSGLVTVLGTQIEFRHPLVRSAVYQGASSGERRNAHLALAEALAAEDPDLRIWHLAAAALGPDENVAAALEQAAAAARERAGFATAASAFERAAGLSPSREARLQRLYRAAEASWQAGRREHAIALGRQALPECEEPRLRADMLHLVGHIEHFGSPLMPALEMLWDAARLVEAVDPAKASAILSDAFGASLCAGEARQALAAARRARELAPSDRSAVDYLADLSLAEALFINGLAREGAPIFERALALFAESGALRADPRLTTRAAIALCWLERATEGRKLVLGALGTARDRGAVALLPSALFISAWAARRVGAWQEAMSSATEGIALARELGHTATMAQCLQEASTIAAARGAEDECRAYVEEGTTAADALGSRYFTEVMKAQVGLLELGLGRNERATEELETSAQRLEVLELRLHELVHGPDLIEALCRLGRVDEARAALSLVRHGSNPRTSGALIERCRGLVAGEGEFEQHFAESLALHPDEEDVFGKARTRLAFGERLRRARRRVEAREQLRAALETFERLRAQPWAERARSELRASGETLRKRDPSSLSQLTPQELQVARFVAQGLANKDVAAQLFLSPRTIDAHLRNVFAKLEITSRTQLARLPLAADDEAQLSAVS